MLPSEELRQINNKKTRIIDEEVANLFAEFLRKSPVGDPSTWLPPRKVKGYYGGSFRAAWELEQRIDGSWVITNGMEYASILFEGRRLVMGRYYGSRQWKAGGAGMLERFNRTLQKRLDRI